MRALRILQPTRVADPRQASSNRRIFNLAFKLGLLAVILEYAISGNTLGDLGIKYSEPGGMPLVKFLPGTDLAMLGAAVVLLGMKPAGAGIIRLFKQTPALGLSVTLMLFCAFYSIVNVGISGAAVYMDSYLSAALLAIAVEPATSRQKRVLAWWVIFFVVLSVFISIGESITQTHLIALHISDPTSPAAKAMLREDADEFRGDGLFAHPLTAALADSMAVFLLLRMRMPGLAKAALFTVLMIGLLSFGGRAAMGTTLVLLLGITAVVLVRGVARRDLSLGFVGTILAAAIVLPLLFGIIISSTDIGARIISHLYVDSSVKARDVEWLVLDHLNLHDMIFGVTQNRLDILKYQIGLGGSDTDIENFWLLMFLNLGVIGFVVFILGFALLLVHLGRMVNHPLGWIMVFAAVLIDSTSNSLGRKSPDLMFMAASLLAMPGFDEMLRPTVLLRRAMARTRQYGLSTNPVNLAGLKP